MLLLSVHTASTYEMIYFVRATCALCKEDLLLIYFSLWLNFEKRIVCGYLEKAECSVMSIHLPLFKKQLIKGLKMMYSFLYYIINRG